MNDSPAQTSGNQNTSGGLGENSTAVVIPAYNHEATVGDVVTEALGLGFPVIVVDDGSTDATNDVLCKMEDITLLRHETNQGKGAALLTGMREAANNCRWAITLDADGQHRPGDAKHLLQAASQHKRCIVTGKREGMTGPDVPWTSSFGRKFSNFWVQSSGGPKLSDSQSGFRLYPLPETLKLASRAKRFQFEVEILVLAHWAGIPATEAPISVVYSPKTGRISHFRPFVDFWRNAFSFTRLIFLRILLSKRTRSRLALRS